LKSPARSCCRCWGGGSIIHGMTGRLCIPSSRASLSTCRSIGVYVRSGMLAWKGQSVQPICELSSRWPDKCTAQHAIPVNKNRFAPISKQLATYERKTIDRRTSSNVHWGALHVATYIYIYIYIYILYSSPRRSEISAASGHSIKLTMNWLCRSWLSSMFVWPDVVVDYVAVDRADWVKPSGHHHRRNSIKQSIYRLDGEQCIDAAEITRDETMWRRAERSVIYEFNSGPEAAVERATDTYSGRVYTSNKISIDSRTITTKWTQMERSYMHSEIQPVR